MKKPNRCLYSSIFGALLRAKSDRNALVRSAHGSAFAVRIENSTTIRCLPTGFSGFCSTSSFWRCWRSTWASSIAKRHVVRVSRGHWLDIGLDRSRGRVRGADLLLRPHHDGKLPAQELRLTLEFLTGYVIEESLSVDNLFVFLVIFRYFAVPRQFAAWGSVLGRRGRSGDARSVHPGGNQAAERVRVGHLRFRRDPDLQRHQAVSPAGSEHQSRANIVLRWFRKLFRVTKEYEGDKFFVVAQRASLCDAAGRCPGA